MDCSSAAFGVGFADMTCARPSNSAPLEVNHPHPAEQRDVMTASRAVWNALVSVLLIQAFSGPPAGAGESAVGPRPKDNPSAGYYALV
jgi:hypothetical protein